MTRQTKLAFFLRIGPFHPESRPISAQLVAYWKNISPPKATCGNYAAFDQERLEDRRQLKDLILFVVKYWSV